MSITVRPDPDHPLGGHALLEVRAPLPPGPTTLKVFDEGSGRYLGPNGWQTPPVTLGPLEARDAAGAVVVPLGPSIVDQIDMYSQVTFTVSGQSAVVSWPASIKASPGRATPGDVKVLHGAQAMRGGADEDENGKGDDGGGNGGGIIEGETRRPTTSGPRFPLVPMLLGLLLLTAAAGAAWYLFGRQDDQPLPEVAAPATPPAAPDAPAAPVAPVPPPAPAVPAGCDAAGLSAAAAMAPAEGFAAIAACGPGSDPDRRIAIIERAAEAGVPAAIAMRGRWWDPAEAARVGSGFTETDPGQAARFYHEARAAGYEEAAALLDRACAALDPIADPLHEMVRDLYCD